MTFALYSHVEIRKLIVNLRFVRMSLVKYTAALFHMYDTRIDIDLAVR